MISALRVKLDEDDEERFDMKSVLGLHAFYF